MSSDPVVKMNSSGLWGQGTAGSVTQTGAFLASDESSGWMGGWSQLKEGLGCHTGDLSFL